MHWDVICLYVFWGLLFEKKQPVPYGNWLLAMEPSSTVLILSEKISDWTMANLTYHVFFVCVWPSNVLPWVHVSSCLHVHLWNCRNAGCECFVMRWGDPIGDSTCFCLLLKLTVEKDTYVYSYYFSHRRHQQQQQPRGGVPNSVHLHPLYPGNTTSVGGSIPMCPAIFVYICVVHNVHIYHCFCYITKLK